MKNYIATIAAAVMMIAAAATANAQPPQGGGRMRGGLEQFITQHKADLGITDDQQAKITKIFSDAKSAASDSNLTQEQKRDIIKKASTDANAVLTADQQEKIKTLMSQARAQGQNNNQGQGQGPRGRRGGNQGGGNTDNAGGGDN